MAEDNCCELLYASMIGYLSEDLYRGSPAL
jgi:hypothetical protein